MRLGDVGHAPGEAPQTIGAVADPGLEVVRHLDDEIAAAEKRRPRAPGRLAAVETQAEPEAASVEGDCALGIGRADDDVVQARHCRVLLARCLRRRYGSGRALDEQQGNAMRDLGGDTQDAPVVASRRRQSAPLEQLPCLAEIGDGEGESRQAVAIASGRRGQLEPRIGELDRSPRRAAAGIGPIGAAAEQQLVVRHGRFERGRRNDDVIERVDHVEVLLSTDAVPPALGARHACHRDPAVRKRGTRQMD